MLHITHASYVKSVGRWNDLPSAEIPEFAFIGRSNVGKSSFINFLTDQKGLALTSSNPGKTQSINLFSINDGAFSFIDLPGYGYARVSKDLRAKWDKHTKAYFMNRKQLLSIFLLIDFSITPQKVDMEYAYSLGQAGLPFAIICTKIDKIKEVELPDQKKVFEKALLEYWRELPPMIYASSQEKIGIEATMTYIEYCIRMWNQ